MNVNGMVNLFNRTIKNILHNFVLLQIITCDDRDPPWDDISIRCLIQDRNEADKLLKEVITTVSSLKNFNPFKT